MSKVDVIVPAYQAAHFLPGAIESVVAQTEPDWRLFLVDDGSTDETEAAVEPYRRRLGAKLVYHRQQNAGVSAARNVAIGLGSAEFVAFLDADDRWLPERLQWSLESLRERPEAGLSYGGVRLVDAAGSPMRDYTVGASGPAGALAGAIYTRRLHLPCLTVTLRREVLAGTGLFDETLRGSEDRDLWLRVAQRSGVAFVPRVMALYRSAAGSASGNLPRMLAEQRRVIDRHYGEPGCGWAARQQALAVVYRDQATGYAGRGQRGAALQMAARSALAVPWSPAGWRATAGVVLETLRGS